jgi:[acyl-carrier-protein] S-malonyltransferase
VTTAWLCSGQGRQTRTMFQLFDGAEAARPVLAAASALLGGDVQRLVDAAPEDALDGNRTGQLLCVTRALAASACLASAQAPERLLVAGYSVGEMAAWGVAGLWSAEETLRLTARRAEHMDAVDTGGGLGFVRGLDRAAVERLVARFSCALAIVNPQRLFIVGGARDDVARCCAAALEAGAVRAQPIAVHVASHTPRLAAAVAPFARDLEALGQLDTRRPFPGTTLLGAADASLVASAASGASGLAAQLATPVDWAATLEALVERGADRLLELGPGDALATMTRGAYPALDVRALDDFRSLAGARSWLDSVGAERRR